MEVVEVELVREDVVAVGSLHVAFAHLSVAELVKSVLVEDAHAENLSSVLLLLDRPVAVLLVDGLEVVGKALIDLELGNLKEGKDGSQEAVDVVSERNSDNKEPESHKEGHTNVGCGNRVHGENARHVVARGSISVRVGELGEVIV